MFCVNPFLIHFIPFFLLYNSILPVPDKIALQALARMSKGGGARRQSAGKNRKSGRNGRRSS
jgi:hypothetical protein